MIPLLLECMYLLLLLEFFLVLQRWNNLYLYESLLPSVIWIFLLRQEAQIITNTTSNTIINF